MPSENIYKSPAWCKIERSHAVEHLRNFGFEMEDIGGDDVVLLKEDHGVIITISVIGKPGPLRPPQKMSDGMTVTFEGKGHGTAPAMILFFKTVSEFCKAMARLL